MAQELVARHAGATTPVEVIVCRPFNHIGPRQSADYFAPNFARQIAAIARGEAPPVIRVGNLTARRDLTDVRDTVRAYERLMARGTAGEIYNVCPAGPSPCARCSTAWSRRAASRVDVEVAPELLRPVDQPLLLGSATGSTPPPAGRRRSRSSRRCGICWRVGATRLTRRIEGLLAHRPTAAATPELSSSHQRRDPLLGRRVGAEERHQAAPLNGLTMNMCAVAGLASIGTRRTPASSLRSAFTRPYGLPAICAPPASAPNSREREIAA